MAFSNNDESDNIISFIMINNVTSLINSILQGSIQVLNSTQCYLPCPGKIKQLLLAVNSQLITL